MLPFVAKEANKSIANLLIDDLNATSVKAFLLDLETSRNCSVSTRNQRLSAIHALAKFISLNSPEHVEWCRQIQIIPIKRSQKKLITYLEKSEMDALLNAPIKKLNKVVGITAYYCFLYNTGARADEAAQLTIADLHIAFVPKRDISTVLIRGKGNKLRRCPLWQQTVDELNQLIDSRNQSEHVFLNRCKQPLNRFGIHALVKRYVNQIATQFPLITKKQVSPQYYTPHYSHTFVTIWN